MPQRRKIHAAPQKQTRKKWEKWVQNQKLRQPHVEKAHPHVEKAQPPTWKKLSPLRGKSSPQFRGAQRLLHSFLQHELHVLAGKLIHQPVEVCLLLIARHVVKYVKHLLRLALACHTVNTARLIATAKLT